MIDNYKTYFFKKQTRVKTHLCTVRRPVFRITGLEERMVESWLLVVLWAQIWNTQIPNLFEI